MDLNIYEVLEGLGLSKNEITIFINLLELGESKAGAIITKSKLQSSAVYNAIHSLIEKGLISYIKKSEVKFYKAANPETILDYIEAKKREYIEILPKLKVKQSKDENEGVEYYKTFRGVKTLVSKMLEDYDGKEVYRYFSTNLDNYDRAKRVYRACKHLRKLKNIKTKAIYHKSLRRAVKPSKTSLKRFIPFKFPNINILNNKIAIISWDDEPSGVLIKSKELYDSYLELFEEMWKVGEK
jgi:sugar-specific transcriptional regulator TrmB